MRTRGGARNEKDALRIELENIIACHKDADDHLRIALLRLAQWARTDEDREIIDEVLEARKAVGKAHKRTVSLHPNKR